MLETTECGRTGLTGTAAKYGMRGDVCSGGDGLIVVGEMAFTVCC